MGETEQCCVFTKRSNSTQYNLRPSIISYWRDSIEDTGASMRQPYPSVTKTVLCVCAVTQAHHVTQYITHTHTQIQTNCVLFGRCARRHSGAQGNGTWGYSGLNGSSGYTAAHKVSVRARWRLMRLCTQYLAQLQRTGVCVSLNCPPVVWASPSGRPCPLASI